MNFIDKLQNARITYLVNAKWMELENATNLVNTEMQQYYTNANPSNTGDAGNAGDAIPTVVELNSLVETMITGRGAFLNAFAAGKHTLKSETNEYRIMGDVEPALAGAERTTGALAWQEATDGFNIEKANIVPKKITAKYGISQELLNYSMVKLIPQAQKRIAESIILNMATSVINGDTRTDATNINTFGVAVASSSLRGTTKNAVVQRDNGLRKLCLEGTEGVTKFDLGTVSGSADVRSAIKKLAEFTDISDYVMITNMPTYITYAETDDLKDKSKNGAGSTISSFAYGTIAGVETIVTSLLPMTDATGVVDGVTPANNTKGSFILVRKNAIQHGLFGSVNYGVETQFSEGMLLIGYAYFGFDNISQKAGRNDAVLAYNITV